MFFAALPAFAATVESTVVTPLPGTATHGTIVGTVDRPLAEVARIVTDCDGFDAWFPDLLESHATGAARCGGTSDLPWPVADRTWELATDRFTAADGSFVASFAYVEGSGNVATMDGRYVLEAIDATHTRVTYEASVDLGFWLPPQLVKWATERVLPGILDGLERPVADARVALR